MIFRLLISCMLFSLVFVNGPFAEFRAAISVQMITPDPLLPVSGGIGASIPTHTQKGDLTVRALVIEQGDVRVAIVSADLLGFPSILGDKVRDLVKGIPPENILIGVTHTHSAPDCYAFPSETGKVEADLDYINMVCQKMALAINDAIQNLQPASIKTATGKAQGKIAYNYYADELYDPRCLVLQCIDGQGNPIATLVNYATHPEVLGPHRGILSPDLCGPLYDRIAAQGGGTAIFMNSAQGGMVTADCRSADGEDIQTWDECIRIGNLLADEALRIVSGASVQKSPALLCKATTVTFQIESPIMQFILKNSPLNYQTNQDGSVSTQVNVVNLGDAQMLTIPGEALPNIGYYLRRNMHGKHNFLLGLTNDAFGYLLTKVDYDSFKKYEYITQTSLGEMAGEIFIEQSLKFINQCPKPEALKTN